MRLMTRADGEQLEAARVSLEKEGEAGRPHAAQLAWLLKADLDEAAIVARIDGADALARRYGAIAAKRHEATWPGAMARVNASSDPDLRAFD